MKKKLKYDLKFLKDFVNSYLTMAAWDTMTTVANSGECQDFTKEGKKTAIRDCKIFINEIIDKFGEKKAMYLLTTPGNDMTYLAAQDFFLTRNRQGTGFWNKEDVYGKEEAKILTDISKEFGSTECTHIGDNQSKLEFW